MSTGLECEFITTPDGTYYILQNGNCPVQCWDWHEYATAYGPFASFDAAEDHLQRNHANPGAFWHDEECKVPTDAVTIALIAGARK